MTREEFDKQAMTFDKRLKGLVFFLDHAPESEKHALTMEILEHIRLWSPIVNLTGKVARK